MKKIILYKFVRTLKSKPNLWKKLKIISIVGGVSFLIIGAFIIWASIKTVNYVSMTANQFIKSPTTLEHVESIKTELKELPKFQPINCWGSAQKLIAFQPWIERSAFENLKTLKEGCLEQKPKVCEGSDCNKIFDLMNTAKGETI